MKIAVIGAGISGIGAAWMLSRRYETHLFENEARLGGHAHTVTAEGAAGPVAIDTGFLVYNELTYPHLIRFFETLGVETALSDMSLSIQVEEKNLEWNGTDLNSVFGQRRNLLRPSFYRMLREILRFEKEAEANLVEARRQAWSLGDLLRERRYSREFCQDYLLPIGAAIWSTPEQSMLDFPAATFIMFFLNHRLLQVNGRPQWRTVKNGSVNYVNRAAAAIPNIHLSSPVERVERRGEKVFVRVKGEEIAFDKVVLATHAPVTARILAGQSTRESAVLGAFRDETNRTVLHRDPGFMPKRERCWASWNVFGTLAQGDQRKVSLTYYLNRLQPLGTSEQYFVTLNPHREIRAPIREFAYDHPQFSQDAIRAQRELPYLQGTGGVYFAGAWTRYGFHEDGLLSAVKVCELLGAPPPWTVT